MIPAVGKDQYPFQVLQHNEIHQVVTVGQLWAIPFPHRDLAVEAQGLDVLPRLREGRGIGQDEERAVALFRKACDGGIADACEAIGAEYKHRRAGQLADAAVFAFYPNKQMTTGEGGMIVTNNEAWAKLYASLRNQGRDVFDAWLNHTRLGYNYRLDEMSAALGLAQMRRIDELLAKRAQVAGWYNERLTDIELNITAMMGMTMIVGILFIIELSPAARKPVPITEMASPCV